MGEDVAQKVYKEIVDMAKEQWVTIKGKHILISTVKEFKKAQSNGASKGIQGAQSKQAVQSKAKEQSKSQGQAQGAKSQALQSQGGKGKSKAVLSKKDELSNLKDAKSTKGKR